MANNEGTQMNRRSFMKAGGAMALTGMSARSYARILGANERIQLGHVGIGNRGRELAAVVAGYSPLRDLKLSIEGRPLTSIVRAAYFTQPDILARPPRM